VRSFTFPYGQNSRQSGQEMISDNYLYWRSSVEEINPIPAWRHITSFVISEEVGPEELEKWVEKTEESNGWLVIMLHGIVDNPANIWQHTRDQFNMVLDVVENSSLEVVLPYEIYETFGYAEGKTPILSTSEIIELDTIGIDSFEERVSLSIPSLGIDSKLESVCEENSEYDFSVLHKAPIWICAKASPYLADIGDYGASIVLGHRQWGPVPMLFAELDLLKEGDIATIKDTEKSIDFTVVQTAKISPDNLWDEIAKYHIQGIEENNSFLILITCTPYGTAYMRLLVILERNHYE
ncbi:MAG: sortase, partial [Candidatus Caldatribacteriota bacterium]|nr:sortase [Candidatus Caldatribacteriota bacterium]